MLHAERVSYAYRASDRLVVDEVSLTITPGDLTGILGPNGSGKTTLLKMLSGTLAPSAGNRPLPQRPLAPWERGDRPRRPALPPPGAHPAVPLSHLSIRPPGRALC